MELELTEEAHLAGLGMAHHRRSDLPQAQTFVLGPLAPFRERTGRALSRRPEMVISLTPSIALEVSRACAKPPLKPRRSEGAAGRSDRPAAFVHVQGARHGSAPA